MYFLKEYFNKFEHYILLVLMIYFLILSTLLTKRYPEIYSFFFSKTIFVIIMKQIS